MRGVLVVGLLVACGADECPPVYVPFDTPICVEGGLADVDLAGEWLLTGTETEIVTMPPSTTVKDIIAEPIMIDARCESYPEGGCTVGSTLAACNTSSSRYGGDQAFRVCRDAQGQLRWQEILHFFVPIVSTNRHQVERLGTLTRAGG
jgi:hypothetical protein